MHAKSKTHKNLALFDFDGTLCRIDSFTKFIFFALPKFEIYKKGIIILPWISAYYLKIYPAHLMRPKLFSTLFKAQSQDKIEVFAKKYANLLLEKYLNPELYNQLKQHQKQGDEIVLVSASIDIYLKHICKELGIHLICTTTEIQSNHYTGQYISPDCSNEQKKIRVLEQYNLDHYQAIYAYGNSEEDFDLLSLTDFPYLTTEQKPLPPLFK